MTHVSAGTKGRRRFLAGRRRAVSRVGTAEHERRRRDACGRTPTDTEADVSGIFQSIRQRQGRKLLHLAHVALAVALCAATLGCTDHQDAQQPTRSTIGSLGTGPSPTTTVPGSGQITVFGLSADEEVALDLQREGLIADCMSRAGFDYTPVEAAQFRAEINERDSTTIPLPLSDQLPPLPTATVSQDPNRDYVQSLSADARSRYFSALTGDPNQPPALLTLPDGTVITTFRGGCWNHAREEMFGDADAAVVGEMVLGNADVAVVARYSRTQSSSQPSLSGASAWPPGAFPSSPI